MPEVRLTLTVEAREILGNLLRLAGPAAARSAVGRARVPGDDPELADAWRRGLAEAASGELAILASALASAKGDPAVVILPDEAAGWAVARALTSVRLTLRETVFPAIPDDALENEAQLARLVPRLPAEQRHALACYDCFGLLQLALLARLGGDEIG